METKDTYQFLCFKNGKLGTDLMSLSDVVALAKTLGLIPVVVVDPPVVVPDPLPPITKPVLPAVDNQTGTVGTSFWLTLPDFGSRIDITSLPPGLRYSGATRTISGVPTQADTRIIEVKNNKGVTLASFSLTITRLPGNPILVPLPPDAEVPVKNNTGTATTYTLLDLYEGTPKTV